MLGAIVYMRILIVSSKESVFSHGSGEVESFLLRTGMQLLGIECDFVGLESRNFGDYDVYLFFSMREDVLEYINYVEKNKYCILFPQIDNPNGATIQNIRELGESRECFLVHSRDDIEDVSYSTAVGDKRLLKERGWFLKPFMHSDQGTDYTHDIVKQSDGYILLFAAYGRDDGLSDIIPLAEKANKSIIVVTDQIDRHSKQYEKYGNVNFLNRLQYGSPEWFYLIKNVDFLYEANPRLTCSVLEALWMGKTVMSCHAKKINHILGKDIVQSIKQEIFFGDIEGCIFDVRYIARYDVIHVAHTILDRVANEYIA